MGCAIIACVLYKYNLYDILKTIEIISKKHALQKCDYIIIQMVSALKSIYHNCACFRFT